MHRNGSRIILPVGIQRFLTTTTGNFFDDPGRRKAGRLFISDRPPVQIVWTLCQCSGIFGPDRARPELAKKIPPRPFPSLRLKSAAGFLTMAVLSQTPGWEGGRGVGKESSSTRVSTPALITLVAERIRGDITPLQRRY